MAQQRLYGVFYVNAENVPMWGLHRNGRTARRIGKARRALVLSMPLPYSRGSWDAPTFRTCADRVECDYRSTPQGRNA